MSETEQPKEPNHGESPSQVVTGRGYSFVHWLCQRAYHSQVRLIHAERLARGEDGPVLYLSLHRSGAMDGFIHHALFPKLTFLIAANLRRHFFLRWFFSGIEIIRKKDLPEPAGIRNATNLDALDRCQSHLAANGHLLVFPEGTSGLGPRHLPFQSGAARILLRFLEEAPGQTITVVPLGIHYERAWAFRSRVEVLVGHPVSTELDPHTTNRIRLGTLRRRIIKALEEVGANFPSAESQEQVEATAYAATLGTGRSYAEALKQFERHYPRQLANEWRSLQNSDEWPFLWRHQGLPLFPIKRRLVPVYMLWFAVTCPWVALGTLLNAPPLLASYLAGKFWADDRNVISLWRVLVGIPATLIWLVLLALLSGITGHGALFAGYLLVSVLGFQSFYRVKKLAVTIYNGLRFPRLRKAALQFHHTVLDSLSHEHTTTPTIETAPSAG